MDQSLVQYLFLGKFVWTNGSDSSSKVSLCTGIGPWMAFPAVICRARFSQRQNLVVKFDGEICAVEFWWGENDASDDFPCESKLEARKSHFPTSPEVRHQFRRNFASFTLEIAGA